MERSCQWVDIDCRKPIYMIIPDFQLPRVEGHKVRRRDTGRFGAPPAACRRAPRPKVGTGLRKTTRPAQAGSCASTKSKRDDDSRQSHRGPSNDWRRRMARKPATREEFVLFDVLYEDGSQRSNRRVPSEILGGLDGDAPARAVIEDQDRLIAEKSGKPALAVKSIRRSRGK
jgi:hypothetical protein